MLHISTQFKYVLETLEASSHPTLHLVVPSYYKLKEVMAVSEDDSEAIQCLKRKIDATLDEKFYSSITQLHWVATFLDPGFKRFKFVPNTLEADKRFRRDLLHDINKWVETLYAAVGFVSEPRTSEYDSIDSPPKKKAKSIFTSMRETSCKTMADATLDIGEEVEKYKCSDVVLDENNEDDPLAWWIANKSQYPQLFRLVRHVMCCPASSAQSERDFSHTGLILTQRRSTLSPKYVSHLEIIAAAHRAGIGC